MRFKNIDDLLVKSTGRAELIKVLGEFKAVRNLNTSFRTDENGEMVASLNQDLFTNISFCKKIKWLYLHCGVPAGYVFEGKVELFVTRTDGGVAILCSDCSR